MISVFLATLRAAMLAGFRFPPSRTHRWWFDNGTLVMEGPAWWETPAYVGLPAGERPPRWKPDAIGVDEAMVWAEFVEHHRATAPGQGEPLDPQGTLL